MFTCVQTYQLWHEMMVPLGRQLSHQEGRHGTLSLYRGASRAAETSSHSSKALLMLCCSRMLIIDLEICLLYGTFSGPIQAANLRTVLTSYYFLSGKEQTQFSYFSFAVSPALFVSSRGREPPRRQTRGSS